MPGYLPVPHPHRRPTVSDLGNQAPKDTYRNLLQVVGGVGAPLRPVESGDGTATPLLMSATAVHVAGDLSASGDLSVSGGAIFASAFSAEPADGAGVRLATDGGQIYLDDGAGATLVLDGAGRVLLADLPTSDPHYAGQLWNSGGTLKVSAG